MKALKGEESDDNKSTTSHRSDATASSRISRLPHLAPKLSSQSAEVRRPNSRELKQSSLFECMSGVGCCRSSAVDSKKAWQSRDEACWQGKAEGRRQQALCVALGLLNVKVEDERERAKRDKERQQRPTRSGGHSVACRLKELQTIMESSSEEERMF